jgi:hypothetical protein
MSNTNESMETEDKRGKGRPRIETRLNPMWKEIILEKGRQGKHITAFLIELGISWEGHYALIKRNRDYSETFNEYQRLCEDWWYNKMHESVVKGESNRFNQRLFAIIMKNKFRDNWSDEKKIDITTQGEKINQDNKIQIEILKTKIDESDIS